MTDAAVIYYTANRTNGHFGDAVRAALVQSVRGLPIVCVSHQPMTFGDVRVCVGDVTPGIWQIYWNILQGALAVQARWVMMAEDDCLYPPEHWLWRPVDPDAFGYDHHRWTLDEDGVFWYRSRNSMALGTCRRDLLIETLQERFAKFPAPVFDRLALRGWGEPGRYEGNLKLPQRKMEKWHCGQPSVIFNHRPSTGGKRRRYDRDPKATTLPPWGEAKDVWRRFHG